MYESPIQKIVGEMQTRMMQQEEDSMMMQVRQQVGFAVDKEELLKALQYDREQYQKGYSDALETIKEKIKEEIQEEHRVAFMTEYGSFFINGVVNGLLKAVEIIDIHKKGGD